MNHSFIKAVSTSNCAKCNRSESDHSDTAQCEACAYTGPCEVISTNPQMLLCPDCMNREVLARVDTPEAVDPKRDRLVFLLNMLDRQIPEDRRGYFVGRIHAIVDIESALAGQDNADYQLAEIVESNIQKMRARIVEAQSTIREMQGTLIADQKYLNQLVPKLREEERAKFKDYDITYKPAASLPKVEAPKTRQSASDKALESMAKLMGVTVDQLKASLAQAASTTLNVKCTCNETPGMCKVHPKGM